MGKLSGTVLKAIAVKLKNGKAALCHGGRGRDWIRSWRRWWGWGLVCLSGRGSWKGSCGGEGHPSGGQAPRADPGVVVLGGPAEARAPPVHPGCPL